MTWQREEPGHSQAWYWPSSPVTGQPHMDQVHIGYVRGSPTPNTGHSPAIKISYLDQDVHNKELTFGCMRTSLSLSCKVRLGFSWKASPPNMALSWAASIAMGLAFKKRLALTHWPLGYVAEIITNNFQTYIGDRYIEHFLWNYHSEWHLKTLPMIVNNVSGNDSMPSGNKPLPEPMLTKISVTILLQ